MRRKTPMGFKTSSKTPEPCISRALILTSVVKFIGEWCSTIGFLLRKQKSHRVAPHRGPSSGLCMIWILSPTLD